MFDTLRAKKEKEDFVYNLYTKRKYWGRVGEGQKEESTVDMSSLK